MSWWSCPRWCERRWRLRPRAEQRRREQLRTRVKKTAQRTGASGFARRRMACPRRLASVADPYVGRDDLICFNSRAMVLPPFARSAAVPHPRDSLRLGTAFFQRPGAGHHNFPGVSVQSAPDNSRYSYSLPQTATKRACFHDHCCDPIKQRANYLGLLHIGSFDLPPLGPTRSRPIAASNHDSSTKCGHAWVSSVAQGESLRSQAGHAVLLLHCGE